MIYVRNVCFMSRSYGRRHQEFQTHQSQEPTDETTVYKETLQVHSTSNSTHARQAGHYRLNCSDHPDACLCAKSPLKQNSRWLSRRWARLCPALQRQLQGVCSCSRTTCNWTVVQLQVLVASKGLQIDPCLAKPLKSYYHGRWFFCNDYATLFFIYCFERIRLGLNPIWPQMVKWNVLHGIGKVQASWKGFAHSSARTGGHHSTLDHWSLCTRRSYTTGAEEITIWIDSAGVGAAHVDPDAKLKAILVRLTAVIATSCQRCKITMAAKKMQHCLFLLINANQLFDFFLLIEGCEQHASL